MGLQIPGELLEVQQTILVDVTFKDYLWGTEADPQSISRKHGLVDNEDGVGGQGGGRFVEMRMCC